jgi:hypothetical protein
MAESVLRGCNLLSSVETAILICCSMSTLYVGSLYLLPQNIRKLKRDDPKQILGRAGVVLLSSFISVCMFRWIVQSRPESCTPGYIWLLGVRHEGIVSAVFWPLCLISMLYAGPLLTTVLLAKINTTEQIIWSKGAFITIPAIDTGRGNQDFLTSLRGVLADRIQTEV